MKFRYICFIIILLIGGCIKKDFDVNNIGLQNYNPGLAVPIFNSNMTLKNMLPVNSPGWTVVEDSSHLLILYFKDSVYVASDSFIKIPNQSFSSKYSLVLDNTVPVGDSADYTFSSNLSFTSSENDLLDEVDFKGGLLTVTLKTNLNFTGRIKVTFPTAVKNGFPFVFYSPYNGDSVPIIKQYDLTGYDITFSHLGNVNQLLSMCDIVAINSGAPDHSPYYVNLNVTLNSLQFTKVLGYFASRSYNYSQFIDLNVFSDKSTGKSYCVNPQVQLIFKNTIGIPFDITLSNLSMHSNVNSPFDVPLSGYNPLIHLAAPVTPGQSVTNSLNLDKTNSNIVSAISIFPTKMSYTSNVTNDYTPTVENFLYDTDGIKLNVNLILPLYGWTRNYTISDSESFNMNNVLNQSNISQLQSATFNLMMINQFPVDMNVQLYFLDSNSVCLDSLFTSSTKYLLKSSIVDNTTGLMVVPTTKISSIQMTGSKLNMLYKARKIYVISKINTSNLGTTNVKFLSTYTLKTYLSVLAKLKVQ